MLYDAPIFRLMGDRSLLIELGDEISPSVNQRVQELFTAMDMQRVGGVRELVPSYRSLLVVYDPLSISADVLKRSIRDICQRIDQADLPEPRTLDIPIVYGGEQGPDLGSVARYHGITPQEVIAYHMQPTYRVYMIGFTPGYPYLGEVPDEIVTPRRETPRTHVPRGSGGSSQKQTGIYSVDSPGGAKPPSFLMMGDRVRFKAITAQEGSQWQQ